MFLGPVSWCQNLFFTSTQISEDICNLQESTSLGGERLWKEDVTKLQIALQQRLGFDGDEYTACGLSRTSELHVVCGLIPQSYTLSQDRSHVYPELSHHKTGR